MTQAFIFDPPYLRQSSKQSVDYWGIGMLAVAVGALQIVLDKGQQEDWFESKWIAMLAVICAITFIAFIVHELRTRNPVVHLRVFKERTYATGVFLMTTLGFVLYGSLVLLPIFLQTLLGYPALQAGIAMAPRGMGSFIAMPIIGILTARFDPRKLLAIGLIGGGYTLFLLSWLNLSAGYWDIFWPQFIQGVSLGLLFVPLTTVTMDRIAREEMGNATSIFNLMRNIGGSMGIAAVTTMLSRRTQFHVQTLGSHVTPYDPQSQLMIERLRQSLIQRGLDPVTAAKSAYAALFGMVQQQASVLSFVEAFYVLGIIFVSALPLVLLLRKPRGAAEVMAH
jgi:DHA2 family multidrug resistance protein